VASIAGIHLHHGSACLVNTVGVVHGLLVTFDHKKPDHLAQFPDGPFKQAGFTRSRGTYQVDCKDIPGFKKTPVTLCKEVVLRQYILLHSNLLPMRMVVIRGMMLMGMALDMMVVVMIMGMGMRPVVMRMIMMMGMNMAVVMIMDMLFAIMIVLMGVHVGMHMIMI
jgi:hypothetical protein